MPRKNPSLLRTAHGSRRDSLARVECPPLDELPDAQPAQPDPVERRPDGRIASREAARLLGARGPLARAKRARFVAGFGLGALAADAPLGPWLASGEDLAAAELARLATVIGAPPSAALSTLVGTWALAIVASRFAYAKASEAGDVAALKFAAGLGDQARTAQLTITALAEREAAQTPRVERDPLADYLTPQKKD